MSDNSSTLRLTELRAALESHRCFGQKITIEHNILEEYIDDSDLALFKKVADSLPQIIARVEKELRSYESDSPENIRHFSNPFLSFEEPEVRDDPDDWSFVVLRSDWPDFSYFIEFRCTQFQEIWAGD